MKVVAIIQARVGSTRFPNKVFADLAGRPLIWHVVNRARACSDVDAVVLATTTNPLDNALESWARREAVDLYRGSEEDVLARFKGAASAFDASIVVRVTADDPCKDPQVTSQVIRMLQEENLAYAYNNKPASFPEGLDTEVLTRDALERADRESSSGFDREHVTQYLFRNPEIFPQKNLSFPENVSHYRLTVDTPTDLLLAREIYSHLYQEGKIFTFPELLRFLKENPELAAINSNVPRSAMYQSIQGVRK